MSLYWPPDPDDADEPRLHALIIGVGHYPHLKGGGAPRTGVLSGLKQLTTTPATAASVARWLADHHHNPDCPLGSIELLISDADGAPAPQPGNEDGISVEAATMANVEQAVYRWYDRCDRHPGNTALLYFAGHGVTKSFQQLLLPADFGANPRNPWANSIEFEGLRDGMRANQAQAQLYFVDACREYDYTVLEALRPQGNSILGAATISDPVETQFTLRSSSEGQKAYGLPGEPTYFAKALLDALSGVGAHNPGGAVVVDTDSLSSALGPLLDAAASGIAEHLTCRNDYERARPVVLHRPASRLVLAQFDAARARAGRPFDLHLSRRDETFESPRNDARPYARLLQPGDWTMRVAFDGEDPDERYISIQPWTTRIEL